MIGSNAKHEITSEMLKLNGFFNGKKRKNKKKHIIPNSYDSSFSNARKFVVI